MRIVVLGLSLSSSWGNGHATTYRALLKALAARGHDILFLEADRPWYAAHRDVVRPEYCALEFYDAPDDLRLWEAEFGAADAVIVGSYVPEGVAAGLAACAMAGGVTAFYDIDTPITLAKLRAGDEAYVSRQLVREYDVYLSFTGGPTLRRLQDEFGARAARALYCSVDPELYSPIPAKPGFDLGYIGTYSADRQPMLDRLLLQPARLCPDRRFVVAGPQYPDDIAWPANVVRIEHLPPAEHARFYSSLRWTLNVTRADMVAAGYSPSVRLFEAGACGVPIISDAWAGLDSVLAVGSQIMVADGAEAVLDLLAWPDRRRRALASRARARVLGAHTAAHRALELESHLHAARGTRGVATRAA